MSHLRDQVALVTGGGSGFGRAIAEHFAAAGAAVVVLGRTKEHLDAVGVAIEKSGGRALAVPGDVTLADDVHRAARAAEDSFGPITLAVHAAGIHGPFGPVWEIDENEWWRPFEVHVRGAAVLVKATAPGMIARRTGRIIAVASLAGTRVYPHLSSYAVSKATEIRLIEHFAAEAREHGVAAFAIEPGTVVTNLAESTMAAPDARRWAPNFVRFLQNLKASEDPRAGLQKCAEFCLRLASGRYDALSGRYLTPEDDLDELVTSCERPS